MAGQDSADRICSVSVDLDALGCYYRIHALPGAPPEPARYAILRRCLPRFAELFARHGVRATFFVVGADLDDDPEGRAALAALARARGRHADRLPGLDAGPDKPRISRGDGRSGAGSIRREP